MRENILRRVRRVPEGRVATYGQIGRLAGSSARQVGNALAALGRDSDAPWHRIINFKGRISARSRGEGHELQKILLEAEGIDVSGNGEIDLARYGCADAELELENP